MASDELRRNYDHISTIEMLRGHGLQGSGIVSAYLKRNVAPLMDRCLALFEMVLGVVLEGMVLPSTTSSNNEICGMLQGMIAMTRGGGGIITHPLFPMPGCPPMRPVPGSIEFVSLFCFPLD